MNKLAKVIARLLGVLMDKEIISENEALYILEPLKEKK